MYLTISPDGILYVADNANGRVQVFRLLPPLVATPATLVLEYPVHPSFGASPLAVVPYR